MGEYSQPAPVAFSVKAPGEQVGDADAELVLEDEELDELEDKVLVPVDVVEDVIVDSVELGAEDDDDVEV